MAELAGKQRLVKRFVWHGSKLLRVLRMQHGAFSGVIVWGT